MFWDDNSVSKSTIVIQYTDKYHKDDQYWKEIDITVYVFKTEPPQFANELNTIVVNTWSQSQQIFELPPIIDPDSSTFDVTFENDHPNWIQVKESNQSSQRFYVIYIESLN